MSVISRTGPSGREERANEAIATYLQAVEEGHRPDRDEWFRRYPDVRDELTSFFAAKEDFERHASPLLPSQASQTVDAEGGVATAVMPALEGYEVLAEMGRGGMGVVYRARHRGLGRVVALKTLRAGELAGEDDLRRFRSEAEVLASLDHPHIVPIYEIGEHEGQPCYAMKLLGGGSLADRLRQGPLPPREAAQLLAAVARAVHHAHLCGVLHRDIKPANVLLDEHGQPHVSDFGLARRLADVPGVAPVTASNAIIGTVAYMAPEQAAGHARHLTTAVDVHALGTVLYECLTGRPPFVGETLLDTLRRIRDEVPPRLSSLRPGINRDLETICLKCLEKSPQGRYPSAAALADDLERWLEGRPIEARPVGAAGRLWRLVRRQPILAGLTTGLLVLLIAATIAASLTAVAMGELADKERQAAIKERDAANAAEAKRQEAENERNAEVKALDRAEGLRLTALSSAVLNDDPGLALLLAIEGEQRAPGRLSQNALLSALNASHEERTLRGSDGMQRAQFSADGRRILAVAESGAVFAWDAATGKKVAEHGKLWQNYYGQFQDACFAPDGQRYAVWYKGTSNADHDKLGNPQVSTEIYYTDRVVRIGDMATGKVLGMLKGHESRVTGVVFSADGRRILTGSEDGTSRLWDGATYKQLHVFRPGRTAQAGVMFSSDGKRVLTWTSGQAFGKFTLPDVRHSPPVVRNVIVDPLEIEDPESPGVVARLGKAYSRGRQGTGGGGGLDEDEQVYATAYDADTGRGLGVVRQSSLARAYNLHHWPTGAAFSPDGSRFFLGQPGFTFGVIYDTETGKKLVPIRDGEFRVPAQAMFSPDGKVLALLMSAGLDDHRCLLLVVDAESGQERSRVGDIEYPAVLEFSPDSHHLVLAAGRVARVWETESFREVAVCRGHNQPITSAAFSPDGRKVVTASADATVRTWQVASSGGHFVEVTAAHSVEGSDFPGPVLGVVFSPDGKFLATTGAESAVRLWDSRTGQQVTVLRGLADMPERHQIRETALGSVVSVQFAPDGQVLVLTRAEKTTIVTASGEKPREVPYCPTRLFDTQGKELIGYQGDTYQLHGAVLSRDGKYVLTTETESVSYSNIERFGGGHHGSSGGRTHGALVARLYDRGSGKLLAVLREPDQRVVDKPGAPPEKEQVRMVQSSIRAATFRPDGRFIATFSEPWSSTAPPLLQLWDTNTAKIVRTLSSKENDSARVIEWSPDGSRLLVHNGGSQGRLIDVEKGDVLATLSGVMFLSDVRSYGMHERLTFSTPFSPDGRRLIGVGDNHTLVILDAITGKVLARGKGHGRPLRQVAFSRDGKRIVSSSEDETARVWDAETGQELLTLNGHRGAVFDACFSPDGKRIATASADGTCRIWALDLLAAALAHKPRELTDEERARFEVPPGK